MGTTSVNEGQRKDYWGASFQPPGTVSAKMARIIAGRVAEVISQYLAAFVSCFDY
jgi:hypothetical protein